MYQSASKSLITNSEEFILLGGILPHSEYWYIFGYWLLLVFGFRKLELYSQNYIMIIYIMFRLLIVIEVASQVAQW